MGSAASFLEEGNRMQTAPGASRQYSWLLLSLPKLNLNFLPHRAEQSLNDMQMWGCFSFLGRGGRSGLRLLLRNFLAM